MPDVAKLKKKAAEFELKKQFDKALAVYVEILDSYGPSDEDVDVSLYNRVGDLYLKQGSVGDAVDYYEQAVDRYAESGFHNNAIALCNKILRQSPGRASIYYKLGKISAQKGFKGDAKKNFLEYADRMQSAGQTDEAFRALKEFADLCPDQDDIRQMLADQLSRKGRGAEAIEQLQLLHERYTEQGRKTEARATVDRMKTIDPASRPRTPTGSRRQGGDSLVFLDLNDEAPEARQATPVSRKATAGLDLISTGLDETPRSSPTIAEPAIPAPEAAIAATPAPTPELLETPELDAVGTGRRDARGGVRESGGCWWWCGAARRTRVHVVRSSAATNAAAVRVPEDGLRERAETIETGERAPELLGEELFTIGEAPITADHVAEMEALDLEIGATDAESQTPSAHGSLMGLPMLVDEEGMEPEPDDEEVLEEESIGGDLPLIMPTPSFGSDAQEAATPSTDDLPLMDLQLPTPGEAMAAINGTTAEVDSAQFDLSTPAVARTPISSERFDLTTPAAARRVSTERAEQSVDLLQALVDEAPDDNALRRRLAEAMLESGDRTGGLRELEATMLGFERADDLPAASKVADEIVLLNPDSVRHHQKRVEYAFRTNERGRLIEAYLELADALFRAGTLEKSRAIYQRVIDLAPDDVRAQAALENIPRTRTSPSRSRRLPHRRAGPRRPLSRRTCPPRRRQHRSPARCQRRSSSTSATGCATTKRRRTRAWSSRRRSPPATRKPTSRTCSGSSRRVSPRTSRTRTTRATTTSVSRSRRWDCSTRRSPSSRRRCVHRAIACPPTKRSGSASWRRSSIRWPRRFSGAHCTSRERRDDKLVGVLYLLGRCAEERGQRDAAVEYYQRVFVVDIQFRDVGERLAAVEGAAS